MPQDLFGDDIRVKGTAIDLDSYIAMLVALRDNNPSSGTWAVDKWSPTRGRYHASPPKVAYKRTVNGIPIGQFWYEDKSVRHPEADKGDPVIRV